MCDSVIAILQLVKISYDIGLVGHSESVSAIQDCLFLVYVLDH